MDDFFESRSVHAGPVSTRTWVAVFFAMIAYSFFFGQASWAWAAGSFALATTVSAVTYIFIYLLENYFTDTRIDGGTSDPGGFYKAQRQGPQKLVMVEYSETALLTIVPSLGITVGSLQALIDAKERGMKHVSLRNLDTYGVISNRHGTEGKRLIDRLLELNMITDIGNSQYEFSPTFTARARSAIVHTVGRPVNDQRISSGLQPTQE